MLNPFTHIIWRLGRKPNGLDDIKRFLTDFPAAVRTLVRRGQINICATNESCWISLIPGYNYQITLESIDLEISKKFIRS